MASMDRDGFVEPVSRVSARPTWVTLAMVVALVLVVGAGWLSAWLPDRLRSADDIVRSSKVASAAPPALDMRVWVDGAGMLRYLHDGSGTWRREYPSASGRRTSFDLSRNDRFAFYDADAKAWVALASIGVTPTPSWGAETCQAARRLDDGTVAGRPAYVVDCGSTRYWIDRETLLILREAGQPRSGVPLAYTEQVVAFVLDPPFATETFVFAPPAGAVSLSWREYNDRYFPARPG